MLRGLYTAASGMIANMVSTDTLASNLANVSTSGFKSNSVNYQGFPEILIQRTGQGGSTQIGSMMSGSTVYSTAIQFQQGTMHETGSKLDMAISGDGFFTVKDKNGNEFYTRNGTFTVSSLGLLTTQEGYAVQGEGGNIFIDKDHSFRVEKDGSIISNGQTIDRLKISRFENNQTLTKLGDSLFGKTALTKPLGSAGENPYGVQQGFLEQSNVNPVRELVNSITGMRLYEALQKNIRMQNDTLEKVVNEVGRVL